MTSESKAKNALKVAYGTVAEPDKDGMDYYDVRKKKIKGAFEISIKMIASYQLFLREQLVSPEMLDVFKEFISHRTPEANFFMTYFNNQIGKEERRLKKLFFTTSDAEEPAEIEDADIDIDDLEDDDDE